MTNQQLKQKAIQEAWRKAIGEQKYKYIEKHIDSGGFANNVNLQLSNESIEASKFQRHANKRGFIRLESLTGIDNNNGWTRIEPDGSNLPVEGRLKSGRLYEDGKFEEIDAVYNHIEVLNAFHLALITHYRPVTELPKPIY